MKTYTKNTIYNFYIEFNRIESYNEYIENWLKNYYGYTFATLIHKTNWNVNDIVDINDFNRVKGNINTLLNVINIDNMNLGISQQINQIFNDVKANEIEVRLNINLKILGETQFSYNICGLTICGNDLKLGGAN